MQNFFRVSVIIPVYNAAASIARAVNSIKNVDEVIEVILVDDGSSDNSFEVCLRLQRESGKIKVVRHGNGQNKGAAASRNLGLSKASCEWIQFLDADDELLPQKLASNKTVVHHQPQADVVIGNYFVRRSSGDELYLAYTQPWIGLIESRLGITSANLFRKSFIECVNGWDETLTSSQEYDLMFRLMKAGAKIAYDSSVCTLVHASEISISRLPQRKEANAMNRINLRLAILSYLKVTRQTTLRRSITIHGFIFKNLGYLEYPEKISFRPNKFMVFLYKICNYFA